VAEARGWAYGGLSPGGRTFFVVPVPRYGADDRVTVESFDRTGPGAP
jgi:hypothetical protein